MSLPWGIDGNAVFKLTYENTQGKTMKSSLDGRQWNRYNKCYTKNFTSTHGKRLRATCKGCFECPNEVCIFYKQFKKKNRFQFVKTAEGQKCKECRHIARHVTCQAVKVWEFPNSEPGIVYVYHTGFHQCTASKKPQVASTSLNETLKKNPKLKPQEAANLLVMEAIRDDATREELDRIAFNLIDPDQLKNLKQKESQRANPCGKFVDNLVRLKIKAENDLNDKFMVYKTNIKELSGGKTYVFKTSKERLQMAYEISQPGEHFLSEEFVFMDTKVTRIPSLKTLGLEVYHPLLQRLVWIARMEVSRCKTS